MIKETFIQEKSPHESGAKHVSGYAHYTDDIVEPEGTLYGAIGWAKKSHAIIKKIDLEKVIKSEGVLLLLLAKISQAEMMLGQFLMAIQFFQQKKLNILVSHYLLLRPNQQSLQEKRF